MAERLSFSESAQRLAQDAFYGMQQAYNDILVHGRLLAHGNMDRLTALNMEIAEDMYTSPQQDELFYLNHFYGHEPPEADTPEPVR